MMASCEQGKQQGAKEEVIALKEEGAYFVSASMGDDNNPGTKNEPWKSLAKISNTVFEAGSTIYLMSDDVFDGTVTLNGIGTASSPITLAAYGKGERPFIKGPDDNVSACVTISDGSSGWRIKGIEIGFGKEGLVVLSSGVNSYFYFEDLYIHDIRNRTWRDDWSIHNWIKWGHGILLTGGGYVNDVTVKNCMFKGNDMDFFPQEVPADQCTGFHNILIEGCFFTECLFNSVYQMPGYGRTGRNFCIRNCMFYRNGIGDCPYGTTSILAGLLSGERDENIVEGNEIGYQQDIYGSDGCAYDFEYTSSGITFRNNFIHDCYGEAILFMPCVGFKNIVIENNLFIHNNKGSKHHRNVISYNAFEDLMCDVTIRNNRFMRTGDVEMIAPMDRSAPMPPCLIMENNIDITDPILNTPVVFEKDTNTYIFYCSDPKATLYYTTDGSVPTKESQPYTGQRLTITKTTALLCKAFRDGYLPSRTCCAFVSPAQSR